jgi:hypothetical protein
MYFAGDHVVQLHPLLRRNPAAIAPATLALRTSIAILPTLAHATVPHDLDRRVVGKSSRQQLEGREVPSAHDNNVRSGHMRFAQLVFPPQTAFDRFASRCFPPRRNDMLKMSSSTPFGRGKRRFDVEPSKTATVVARPSGTTSKRFAFGWGSVVLERHYSKACSKSVGSTKRFIRWQLRLICEP